jgi:LysM repeat protein
MECPICKHSEVEKNSQSCPKCHSNLQAFQVLESIEKKLKHRKYFIYFLSAFVLILMAAWSFTDTTAGDKLLLDQTRQLYKDSLTEQQNRVEELTVEFEEMELSNVILGEKLKTFEFIQSSVGGELPDEDYHVHVVKKGESLWSIAEEYHSDGNRHKEIAGHNELNDPHFIAVGDTVIIKK